MFGETEYDPNRYISSVSFEEQLDALGRAVDAGKIRYIGLSNETPYGVMKFIQVAESGSCYPRPVSLQVFMAKWICVGTGTGTCVQFFISLCQTHRSFPCFQNAYNLLCRNFDFGLAECCHHERVSLLAYSPLAMGILSGKYFSHDGGPADARLNLFRGKYSEAESRYNLSNTNMKNAAKEYVNIAKKYGVQPVSLAIAFVLKNPLVASAIFGATKLWQLQEVIDASRFNLSPEIIAEINRVHSRFPNPCP